MEHSLLTSPHCPKLWWCLTLLIIQKCKMWFWENKKNTKTNWLTNSLYMFNHWKGIHSFDMDITYLPFNSGLFLLIVGYILIQKLSLSCGVSGRDCLVSTDDRRRCPQKQTFLGCQHLQCYSKRLGCAY